tara:strand:+ start:135 stop:467 length:333 start_codon:yes stop_codon:yes gene_type:complete
MSLKSEAMKERSETFVREMMKIRETASELGSQARSLSSQIQWDMLREEYSTQDIMTARASARFALKNVKKEIEELLYDLTNESSAGCCFSRECNRELILAGIENGKAFPC